MLLRDCYAKRDYQILKEQELLLQHDFVTCLDIPAVCNKALDQVALKYDTNYS